MPKISVLIPVYNVETYLEQCLDSLLCQTFQDIEMICVDDGSTDGSGQILDRYADSDTRIRVIHKKNTGYGNSMNTAMSHALGDYIAIVESDDFVETDMLQKLHEAAEMQAADVVKADYYRYYDGQDTKAGRLDRYPQEVLNVHSCPDILNLPDTIWSCLYRRSFLLKNGIRFHETRGASYQDISFALQVWMHAERVCFIRDAVIHYRMDNPASSMNDPSKLFCVFHEYGLIEEKFDSFLKENPDVDQYFIASKYRDYFNHYYRVGVQYQYALLLRLWQSYQKDKEVGRILGQVFLPHIWDQLNRMETDLNSFFRQTAKWVEDQRLSLCEFKNETAYGKGFFAELGRYQQVIVYGAGKVGCWLAGKLLAAGGKVNGFAVTQMSGNPAICMGIPVYELQDLSDMTESCAIVIAAAENKQHEMYMNLKKCGFANIFRVDKVVRSWKSELEAGGKIQ